MLGGRLLDDELLSFIGIHFAEELSQPEIRPYKALSTKPETNRSGAVFYYLKLYLPTFMYFSIGSRIVWFENALTGELIPIAKRMINLSSDNVEAAKLSTVHDSDIEGADSNIADGSDPHKTGGRKYGSTEGDDDEESPLLAAIPVPAPLVPTLSGNADKSARRVTSKTNIGALADQQSKLFDEASKITAYNNLVTTQRGFFLFFQVVTNYPLKALIDNFILVTGNPFRLCFYDCIFSQYKCE